MKSIRCGLVGLAGASVVTVLPAQVQQSCISDRCLGHVAVNLAEFTRFQITAVASAASTVTVTKTISRDIRHSSPSSRPGDVSHGINTRVAGGLSTIGPEMSLPVRQSQVPLITATHDVSVFPTGSYDSGEVFRSACSCHGITAATTTPPSRETITETQTSTVYPTAVYSSSSTPRRVRRDELEDITEVIPDDLVASKGEAVFSIGTLDEEEYVKQVTNIAAPNAESNSKSKRDDDLGEVENVIDDELIASEGEATFSISTLDEGGKSPLSARAGKQGKRDGDLEEVDSIIDDELIASEGLAMISISTLDDEEKAKLSIISRFKLARRNGEMEDVEA